MRQVKELAKRESLTICLTMGQIRQLVKRAKKGKFIRFYRKGVAITLASKGYRKISKKNLLRAKIKALRAELKTVAQ